MNAVKISRLKVFFFSGIFKLVVFTGVPRYLGFGPNEVGAFYEGELEEKKGAMWKVKLSGTAPANSRSPRALVTAAKLSRPQPGQELWVSCLAMPWMPWFRASFLLTRRVIPKPWRK